jgi:hypothetical protein
MIPEVYFNLARQTLTCWAFLFSKMSGWIKLHRQLQDHWIWSKPEYLKWWLDILMSANIEPKRVLIKGQLLEVSRGEVIYSYETWANRWKINKSKVLRFLKMLEKDSMILLKSETVTTRLTICKYDTYQGERNDSETQVKRIWNASETQVKPTKEVKELKNEIILNRYIIDEEFFKELPMQVPFANQLKSLHNISDSDLDKFIQEYLAVNEGKEFKVIQDLKRDFNYFIKNSINFQSKVTHKPTYRPKEEKPKSKNIFADMYEELLREKEKNNQSNQ